jgi:hypothetical protein
MKRISFVQSITIFLFLLSIINLSCSVAEKAKKIDELMNFCYNADIFNGAVCGC